MRSRTRMLPAIVLVIVSACWCLAAEEGSDPGGLSASLELTYASRYVWRGLLLNPDPVLQPSLTLSHTRGLSLNIWGSVDTTGAGEQIGYGDKSGSLTEIDYTLDYSWARGDLTCSVGLIGYTFPHTGFDSTGEVYAAVCLGGSLSPVLSINYDFDEADGFYASLGASYACSLVVGKQVSPNLNFGARISYASANYNRFYFGEDKAAVTDLLLSAGLPFSVTDRLTITPAISYSVVLDSDLRDAVGRPDSFVAGITVGCRF